MLIEIQEPQLSSVKVETWNGRLLRADFSFPDSSLHSTIRLIGRSFSAEDFDASGSDPYLGRRREPRLSEIRQFRQAVMQDNDETGHPFSDFDKQRMRLAVRNFGREQRAALVLEQARVVRQYSEQIADLDRLINEISE